MELTDAQVEAPVSTLEKKGFDFDPKQAWNVDKIAPHRMTQEQIDTLLVGIPEEVRAVVEAQLNFISGDVNSRIGIATRFPEVARKSFQSSGEMWTVPVLNNIDKYNRRGADLVPLTPAENAILEILQRELGATQIGEDPVMGLREFKTDSPGLRLITSQHDTQGSNVRYVTGVQILLEDPSKPMTDSFAPMKLGVPSRPNAKLGDPA